MATGKARPKDAVTTAAFIGRCNRGLLRKNRVLQFIKKLVIKYQCKALQTHVIMKKKQVQTVMVNNSRNLNKRTGQSLLI